MKFVSEQVARKLQKLNFDEPCIAKYTYASSSFVKGSPMSLYPHTQDFFKGPGIETCCNSDYENSMNANGNIPVICAPDLLTTILWIGAKHRKISLEEDGVYEEWVSAYRGGYRPGEPYSILEKNIDEALDDMLKK